MSRIGRMPIKIPEGVDVTCDGTQVTVKGKGTTLEQTVHPDMKITVKDGVVTVDRPSEEKKHKALHGLTRSLINNMVIGVSEGFTKSLEINGVGYRAAKDGKKLVLSLGYSHPIHLEEPDGITIEVPANNKIVVKGADKQHVGQIAAKIRSFRLPDPYKGKGIRYEGEYVRIKEGKTGAVK